MIKFAIRKRCKLKPEIPEDELMEFIKDTLYTYFSISRRDRKQGLLTFHGSLRSFWENCAIDATLRIHVDDDILSYEAECDIKPELKNGCGGVGGIIAVLLITWFLGWLGTGIQLVLALVAVDMAEFLFSFRRPERYLNEIFEALQFKYGLSTEKIN